jgi:hypothetical protein
MSRFFFQVAGRWLDSSVPLPELRAAPPGTPGIVVEFLPPSTSLREQTDWFHGWKLADEDAEYWLKLARSNGDFLLRYPTVADFRVSADGARISCEPLTDIEPETLRHLLLDQVLPFAFGLGGDLVVHASALSVENQGIGLIGVSGQGKSTLAASFAANGFPLLTDDCLLLHEQTDTWLAVPYYSGVRLWPTSLDGLLLNRLEVAGVAAYTSKRRVRSASVLPFTAEALPLRHLFFLAGAGDPRSTISIEPMPYQKAFLGLVKNNFLLEIREPAALKRQFDQISRLTSSVSCWALSYPRDFRVLGNVRAAVLEHIGWSPNSVAA